MDSNEENEKRKFSEFKKDIRNEKALIEKIKNSLSNCLTKMCVRNIITNDFVWVFESYADIQDMGVFHKRTHE